MKKILAIIVTLSMVLSVPVFADTNPPTQTTAVEETTTAQPTPEAQNASDATTTTTEATEATDATDATTTTTDATDAATTTTDATEATTTTVEATTPITTVTTAEAGVTPDSLLYSLDKLMEKIQLALVTDAVKEAELLAKIAQERLAESNEMLDKADVELTQVALQEYKDNLEKAIKLIEVAMEDGKQVASVMDLINDANLKDAAAIEKILANIPEEFRDEVKAGIEDLAAATEAATDTAQVVEGTEVEENSVKQEITNKIIEEKIKDAALLAKIDEAGLNTRQIIALMSLAEQSKKPLAEVIDLFVANEMGIGSTAKELGLTTKDALKGINSSFKDTKETIKNAFKAAIKLVDEDDQEEVEDIVDSTLAGQTEIPATKEAAKQATAKLEKIVKEAKAQIETITANKDEKVIDKAEKEIEKLEKDAEKAIEKIEKAADKDEAAKTEVEDDNDDADEEKEVKVEKVKENEKENKGKSEKKN